VYKVCAPCIDIKKSTAKGIKMWVNQHGFYCVSKSEANTKVDTFIKHFGRESAVVYRSDAKKITFAEDGFPTEEAAAAAQSEDSAGAISSSTAP